MNELINEYLKLNKEKKEIEEKINEIKKEIKLNMRAEELNVYNGDKAEVFYSEVKRTNFDKNKAKEFITEEQFEECLKESTFDRLEIKEIK